MEYNIPTELINFYGANAELRALWQIGKELNEEFYQPYEGRIYIKDKKFYAIKRVKDELTRLKISNFTFKVTKVVYEESETQTIMDIMTPNHTFQDIVFPSIAFTGLAEFHKILKKVDRTLYIKNGDYLQLILDWNKDTYNEKKITGTKKTGIHGDLFVTSKRTYKQDLKTPVDELIYLDSHEYIKSDIMQAGHLKQDDLSKEFLQALLGFNNKQKCISILSWCMACFYKDRLSEAGYKLPILTLVGEAGAGKTTTVDTIVRNIFSTDNLLDAGGSTKFTLLKNANSSNCTPLLLDEYKPNKLGINQLNMLSQFFRNIYDVAKEQRGHANQSIETFTLTAPLIVIGESVTNENALTERSIFLDFFKKDLEEVENATESIRYLKKNKDKIKRLGFSMLHYAMNDNTSINELREELEKIEIGLDIEIDRIRASTAILTYFYGTLCKVLRVTQKTDCSSVLSSMVNASVAGSTVKSELTRTLELINIMIERDVLVEHYDYKQVEDVLYLPTTRIFLKINKFVRDYAIDDNILGREQFQKAVRKQDYFIDYKNIRLNDKEIEAKDTAVVKCYSLSINKLKKVSDNFPALKCTEDKFEEN